MNQASPPSHRDRTVDLHRESVKRRLRTGLAWTYVVAVIAAGTAFVIRDFNAEQVRWLTSWGLLFLAPSILTTVLQVLRRRMACADAGRLIKAFPAQRTARMPSWLVGCGFLIVAAAPFFVLFFRDGHVLLVVALAFGGVLSFSAMWLWFDGIPLECRENGLLIDGTRFISWRDVVEVDAVKRTNVLELRTIAKDGRRLPPGEVFVCAEDRIELIDLIREYRDAGLNSPLAGNAIYGGDELA